MTTFRYEAARRDGVGVRGMIESTSRTEAAALLSERGLFPTRVEAAAGLGVGAGRRPSVRQQALVVRSLASFVEAGIPLVPALDATRRNAPSRLASVLEAVTNRVGEGVPLSTALVQEGAGFSGVTIGLIRSGEGGAGLARALIEAAVHLEREAETAGRIRTALAYPMVLLSIGMISVTLIVVVLVPRFAELLRDAPTTPPLATRMLFGLSHGLRYGGPLLVPAAAAIVGLARSRRLRPWWSRRTLSLPGIGAIRHGLATSRTCRILSALLSGGVPLVPALRAATEATADAEIQRRLAGVRDRIAEGSSLSDALVATQAFAPNAVQLVRVGEGTGRLALLLERAAAMEQAEAERRLHGLVTILEPALIVLFAAVVAFVAAALLQAIYSVRPPGS